MARVYLCFGGKIKQKNKEGKKDVIRCIASKVTEMKRMKIFATIMAIIIIATTLPAFAAEKNFANEVVVKNTGDTKSPVFQAEDDVFYFCLERDVKAPGAEGVIYTKAEDSSAYAEDIEKIQGILVNFYGLQKAEATITGFAIWGVLENEVENYRVLTTIRGGEEAKAAYEDVLVAPVNPIDDAEGYWNLEYAIYTAEGYQTMITAKAEWIMAEIPTEEPTEPPVEETTEPETEEPTTEPETEEPTTEVPTEVPTEEPTEPPVEETTEPETEETIMAPTEEPTTEVPTEVPTEAPTEPPVVVGNEPEPEDIVAIPHTGVEQNLPILPLIISIATLMVCVGSTLYEKKKYSLV